MKDRKINAVYGPVIVTDRQEFYDHAVLFRDNVIVDLVHRSKLSDSMDKRRVPGMYLVPGLVDIHVHGAHGRSFIESSDEAYQCVSNGLLSSGVTTALPTISSAPLEQTTRALGFFAEHFSSSREAQEGDPLPRFPGIHLEGPYFSPEQAGAQDPTALRMPNDGSLDQLLKYHEDISLMSYAPELPGAVELTKALVVAGITPAAGHSNGTTFDLNNCIEAGLSHIIHIFSGQSSIIRQGPWRIPGILESTLASDSLTVEMIADGKHLPKELMAIAHKALGQRLCIVSDASAGAGLPEDSVFAVGNTTRIVRNGVGMTMDRKSFAGSTTLLGSMLSIARDFLDARVPDLVAMVTEVPAYAAKIPHVGRIAPGHFADFCVLSEDLTVRAVAKGGIWIDSLKDKGGTSQFL